MTEKRNRGGGGIVRSTASRHHSTDPPRVTVHGATPILVYVAPSEAGSLLSLSKKLLRESISF